MNHSPLDGRTIAVPETRQTEVLARMLERRGARVLRCPLVSIVDAPDPVPVLAWVRDFNVGTCDDLILYTGEGLRRLLSCIDQHQPDLRSDFIARLGQVRLITRGPKPGRVLRELGLKPELTADPATTEGLIGLLRGGNLQGRRIGVQCYGQTANRQLMDFLAASGASVAPVAPYAYADQADEAKVMALIEQLCEGAVDAIAFTSTAQVKRLFEVARRRQCEVRLESGLARCIVTAVGPVVAAALEARGVKVDAQPEGRYFLKPMIRALETTLAGKGLAPP